MYFGTCLFYLSIKWIKSKKNVMWKEEIIFPKKFERTTMMKKYRLLTVVRLLALAAIFVFMGTNQGSAQTEPAAQPWQRDSNAVIERITNRITQADRQAAAERRLRQCLRLRPSQRRIILT